MAKINQIFVAISLILIISFVPNRISCKPTGRNSDLIDGNDFLSLFLDQNNQPNSNDEKYDDLEKSDNIYSSNKNNNNNNLNNRKNTNKNIDLNDDINPLETIMSNEEELLTQDSSNYGQRLRERIQNQKYIPKLNHQSSNNNNNNHNPYKLTSETTTDDDFIENSEKIISVESPSKKQIIKMVTSGSKIVFLEEMTPLSDRTYHKNINNNSNKINATSDNNSKFNNNTKDDSDDIQVISISVSSTVGRSKKQHQQNLRLQPQQHRKSNNFMKLSSTIEPIPTINDNFTNSSNSVSKKNDFINRSHKSEFSIEESEPVTQIDNMSDSVNGESTNIHSILAPPQQSVTNQTHNNLNHRNDGSNRDILNTNTKTEPTNRMERKQDKLVPFQTVIYHDTGFNKDGSAQPRSISYSSVGQSIDQLNAWKDLEGLLEAKENVSESLRKPPLSSSSNQGYHHHATVSPKINHHHQQHQNHPKVYSQPEKVYSEPAKFYSEPAKMYGEPSKFYSEPSKIYSEPSKVYGQPEKQYGEPAKIYSEPSKVYSEPAKVYSEPAKVYGEPSKVYWPRPTTSTTTTTTTTTTVSPLTTDRNQNSYSNKLRNSSSLNSNSRRVIFNLDKLPYDLLNAPESSKRLLVPDINSGRRLRPSSINVDSKNSNDDIDYDNNSNENDQNNRSKYQQSNHFHQQHQYHQQQQQENHHQSSQNKNLPISQMNIKNNNLNYQHIQHNNNNNNRGNNIQGRNQQQSLLHHHSSSDEIIYNNRPDLVTDNPKYLSVTENSKNLYTPTPEQNYEIEESVSVMTNGRANGIQHTIQPTRSSINNIKNVSGGSSIPSSSANNSDDSKVGYVVEGRNFRKYRVEEKTDDGFIVGEYGVVSHNDGGVRGVRYTADSNINPTLIHQALMKFLSL